MVYKLKLLGNKHIVEVPTDSNGLYIIIIIKMFKKKHFYLGYQIVLNGLQTEIAW